MDPLETLLGDIEYLDYDEVAAQSALQTHADFFNSLLKMNKKQLAATLINYSYVSNNDKSTGTSLEAAIARVMGSKVDHSKKHGCDSFYDNGNTLEIKPENIYEPRWDGKEYIPTNSKRLNMLGKYNDFTWHGLIRYICGTETNSNQSKKYRKEIWNFIDKYYTDPDYKAFMKVACHFYGREVEADRQDKKWWKLVGESIGGKLTLDEVKKKWGDIVDTVRWNQGKIKPTKWNKYQVSGGSVNGKLVYVARIDFPVIYEKLFEQLLDFYPPEKRFRPVKYRCQINFTHVTLNSSNIHRVKWMYLDPNIQVFKKCFAKGFWDIIVLCHPELEQKENELTDFERLFDYG